MPKYSTRDRIVADLIEQRKPFKTYGSFYGTDDYLHGTRAQLPYEFYDSFAANDIDYVVYSYRTPIAWHHGDTDTWTVPNIKYSVTTTKHQSQLSRVKNGFIDGTGGKVGASTGGMNW